MQKCFSSSLKQTVTFILFKSGATTKIPQCNFHIPFTIVTLMIFDLSLIAVGTIVVRFHQSFSSSSSSSSSSCRVCTYVHIFSNRTYVVNRWITRLYWTLFACAYAQADPLIGLLNCTQLSTYVVVLQISSGNRKTLTSEMKKKLIRSDEQE